MPLASLRTYKDKNGHSAKFEALVPISWLRAQVHSWKVPDISPEEVVIYGEPLHQDARGANDMAVADKPDDFSGRSRIREFSRPWVAAALQKVRVILESMTAANWAEKRAEAVALVPAPK